MGVQGVPYVVGVHAEMPYMRKEVRPGTALGLRSGRLPVNERWQESARPAYCNGCGWSRAVKDVKFLEGDFFPFRCPSCGGIVANRRGEG